MENPSRILVVDDHLPSQQALASLLESEGYRLAFAASGPEALSIARALVPDLVLLDVMMPGMDGFEVCRHLRADSSLALVPIVMVTALEDQESRLCGLNAGADDFVTKPYSRVELRARVRTITRLNRYRVLLDEQRRASHARLQLLWAIDRSADGYLLLDPDDRPQYGNAQAWRYLGCTPDEAGQLEPFVAQARRHYRLEPTEAWASWPAPTPQARYLVRPETDESSRWLQVDLLSLPADVPEGRLIQIRDVTEQIDAQRHLWTFHSFVSHKLRTPLTSLLVGVGLLNRAAGPLLSGDHAMLLEKAYGGAQQLKRVLDEIFRYIEAPLGVTRGEGCALNAIPALLSHIGSELPINRLTFVYDDLPLAARLTINEPTVDLVLTELIENCTKFHPQHTPTITVYMSQSDDHAMITVADDGTHLPPEQIAQIGQPYRQVDREFTGQVPGLGLGLATITQICWAVGGACHIRNRPDGPGLVVTLDLPLATTPALTTAS